MVKLREGWKVVVLGDVVEVVTEYWDRDPNIPERFVAGEHIDEENLRVRRWGVTGEDLMPPTFNRRFRAEDVLFHSRNLRKLAQPDFSGITGEKIFVLRSRDNTYLLPSFLPFILQTMHFVEYVNRMWAGSTNKFLNKSPLVKYEFALPPISEQRRLTKVLAAFEDCYQTLLEAEKSAHILLKSTLDALYLEQVDLKLPKKIANYDKSTTPRRWPLVPLGDVCSVIRDGVHKRPNYVASGIPFITVENLTRGRRLDLNTSRFISQEDHLEFTKRIKPEFGDVLISKDGTLGVARMVDVNSEFSIFVSVAMMRPLREVLDGKFLRYFFDSSLFRRVMASKVSGSALPHIHLGDLRKTLIPLPTMPEQQRIADLATDLEKCEATIQERRINMLCNKRSAINQLLMEGAL